MPRILVAEDDDAVRAFVARALALHGHEVTAVTDGGRALEALAGDRYDLLLTDIVMPGLDGIEGIEQRLRAAEPVVGNGYELDEDASLRLPNTLEKAVDLFSESELAKKYLGEAFVRHFSEVRRWENHQERIAISHWEIARYLEHI